MYATKTHFPKKVESSIYIGDEFVKKPHKASRQLGKQFTSFLGGNNFGSYEFKSDPLQEMIKYSIKEPADKRKNGFGSHMPSCTDEFSSTIRTEQHRETLAKEFKMENEIRKRVQAQESRFPTIDVNAKRATMFVGGKPMSDRTYDRLPKLYQRRVPTSLYDIGKEQFGGLTPTCNRCNKDKFFCIHRKNAEYETFEMPANEKKGTLISPKYCGPYFVTSEVFGNFEGDITAIKPEHGRQASTKEFFDTVKGGSLIK